MKIQDLTDALKFVYMFPIIGCLIVGTHDITQGLIMLGATMVSAIIIVSIIVGYASLKNRVGKGGY